MDLRQLEYVLAVAEHGNFTRAAGQLHVAQPALSVAVRRLETELGVRLFHRTSRRVTLTDAGEALVARAARIVGEADELRTLMLSFAGGSRGRLRVSAWYHMEPRLASFLQDLLAEVPLVEVTIAELAPLDALEAVKAGDLDIALVDGWGEISDDGVEHVVLRSEPYVLVTPPNHPYAGKRSVRLADVLAEAFVVARRGTPLRWIYDQAFPSGHERPAAVIETNELASTVAFVSVGLGCAILLESIVEPIGLPVGVVPISDVPNAVLAVVWAQGPATAVVQRAVALVKERGAEAPRQR
jgi:LysR family transcriptional regulator, transcription activator of glutamate synthase operon